MLASKAEQSEKIAQSIKDDMIPFILASIDNKSQQIFRDKQKRVKETRAKVRILLPKDAKETQKLIPVIKSI